MKAERQPTTEAKTKVRTKGVALLAAGVGAIATGVYLLVASGVIGLFLLLFEVVVVASTVDIDGDWFGERRARQVG